MIRRPKAGARRLLLPLAAVVLLAGCLHPASPAAPRAAPASSSTAVPVRSRPAPSTPREVRAVRAVLTTLRAYLDTWRRGGIPTANARYLSGDERVVSAGSDAGFPRLASASLASHHLIRWRGPTLLQVEVILDMRFHRPGVAWGDGPNDRFVTAHLTRAGRYRLHLATSP